MSKHSNYDIIIRLQEPDMAQIDPAREDYRSRLADALNWINYIFTTKELRDFYLEHNRDWGPNIPNLNEVEDWRFVGAGKHAYLLKKGAKLNESGRSFFAKAVAEIQADAKRITAEKAKLVKRPTPSPEIVLRNEINSIVQRIEDLILTRTYNPEGGQVVSIVRDAEPSKAALDGVVQGLLHLRREVTDTSVPDYAENIELMGPRAKYVADCLGDALRQLNMEVANSKIQKVRKPKTIKEKAAVRQTKDIKHKKIDTDINVVSIDPSLIVGATGLVVYNTKSRRVGIYVANDNETLDIRGTTLQNYSVATSKTLRRPEEDLIHFRTAPTMKRVDVLLNSNIRGKTFPMNGRINKDTMLLKVFK